jgi:uncharacterized RDD family membrane protein YckC
MDWYYVLKGSQAGPVSEEELQNLVAAGTVTSATLVWRQGMPAWQPFGQARAGAPHAAVAAGGAGGAAGGAMAGGGGAAGTAAAPAAQATCSQCGKTLPREELIRYAGQWVCAACKPTFVQRLKEGAAIPGVMRYGGFWIRFGALLIDGLILWIGQAIVQQVAGLGLFAQPPEDPDQTLAFLGLLGIVTLVNFAIAVAYEVFFLGRFGATPGKMACRLKVVRPDGSPISYLRALGRYFARILSSLILMIGYLMAAFDEEKRSLHDRICDTRVSRV